MIFSLYGVQKQDSGFNKEAHDAMQNMQAMIYLFENRSDALLLMNRNTLTKDNPKYIIAPLNNPGIKTTDVLVKFKEYFLYLEDMLIQLLDS